MEIEASSELEKERKNDSIKISEISGGIHKYAKEILSIM